MRLSSGWAGPLLLASSTSSAMMVRAALSLSPSPSCKEVEVDKAKFDLSELAGPHTVVTGEFAPPSHYNRTYTLDLCAPLERKGDVDARFKCPKGTHGNVYPAPRRIGGCLNYVVRVLICLRGISVRDQTPVGRRVGKVDGGGGDTHCGRP